MAILPVLLLFRIVLAILGFFVFLGFWGLVGCFLVLVSLCGGLNKTGSHRPIGCGTVRRCGFVGRGILLGGRL